jgi:hypothetical protein
MEYLAAHAGYSPVHNPRTGEKDLVRLPGLVAIAYQHETSRCGDPHLHTHVIVPNRQARADGQLVSIDGTSPYHEGRAAGVIYQATLRRELHQSLGLEWAPVDPSTGMAELAGVDRDTITAWSRRSTALREWAAHNLHIVDGPLSAAQLAAAQKARRRSPAPTSWNRGRAQLPVDAERSPRLMVEAAVDEIGVRLTAPRQAHQREGHERFTLDVVLAEEQAVMDLVDARDDRSMLWVQDEDTAALSPDQQRAVENIGRSPWLVQPLSAPAGAGKTTSMRALVAAAHRRQGGKSARDGTDRQGRRRCGARCWGR